MPAQRPARRVRVLLTVVALVLVAAIAAWFWPLQGPASTARSTLEHPAAGVVVSETAQSLTFTPATAARGGLVFFPGARIDPRSYAPLLEPLAAQGYIVEVVKAPFGISLLAENAATSLMARHPDVTRWAVGGHSLGGVAASDYVTGHPSGPRALLLWASYPNQSLADRDVCVTSISGSEDGLSTPAKLDAHRDKLPSSTRYLVIKGANHAAFGDYGPQEGDGVATLPSDRAQQQITDLSAQALAGC